MEKRLCAVAGQVHTHTHYKRHVYLGRRRRWVLSVLNWVTVSLTYDKWWLAVTLLSLPTVHHPCRNGTTVADIRGGVSALWKPIKLNSSRIYADGIMLNKLKKFEQVTISDVYCIFLMFYIFLCPRYLSIQSYTLLRASCALKEFSVLFYVVDSFLRQTPTRMYLLYTVC